MKAGDRILFVSGPGEKVRYGEVTELSPNGKHVGIYTGGDVPEWHAVAAISVIEALPALADTQ